MYHGPTARASCPSAALTRGGKAYRNVLFFPNKSDLEEKLPASTLETARLGLLVGARTYLIQVHARGAVVSEISKAVSSCMTFT